MNERLQGRVNPAPVPSLTPVRMNLLQRKCACGGAPGLDGECAECRRKRLLGLQPQGTDQPKPSAELPAVRNVLRSPGQSLDVGTRTFMEERFGHDFGRVRVHADARAAESARALNAHAYTVGRDVVFGEGAYAPGTTPGTQLLAHELTHVVQQVQSSGSYSQSPEALEAEASQVSGSITSKASRAVTHATRPGSIQFERIKVGKREFEVGDVRLNNKAAIDVRKHGVLLAGPDQGHIVVSGDNRLGYEVAHTTPDDPFRWERLKEIVDTGGVDVRAVSSDETFLVKEIIGGQAKIVKRSLLTIPGAIAGGITLPPLSRAQNIEPSAKARVVSPDDSRYKIFYESGAQGRGMVGGNSLAHEFYGHLWLAIRGVPWGHGRELTQQHGITDPLGRPFVGPVDKYIEHFASASAVFAFQSQTQGVSQRHLEGALTWLETNGANELTLHRAEHGADLGEASAAFGLRWEVISQNYEILLIGPQAGAQPPPTVREAAPQAGAQPPPTVREATPQVGPQMPPLGPSISSPQAVVKRVVAWASTLIGDKKRAFNLVLSGVTQSGFGGLTKERRRTRLAQDVLRELRSSNP